MYDFCSDFCGCPHHIIKKALFMLAKEDEYLLLNQINERSITHKLAEYIQQILPEYNVDCEYNKHLKDPKTLDFTTIVNNITKFLQQGQKDSFDSLINFREFIAHEENIKEVLETLLKNLTHPQSLLNEEGKKTYLMLKFPKQEYVKKVYPDIIIHFRGTNINKIVIEAKKESNKNTSAKIFDLLKLGLFTQSTGEYKYNIGYFIDFPKQIKPNFRINITPCNIVPHSNVYIIKIIN